MNHDGSLRLIRPGDVAGARDVMRQMELAAVALGELAASLDGDDAVLRLSVALLSATLWRRIREH